MQRHVYFLCSVLFIYPICSVLSSTGVPQESTTSTPKTTQAPVITYTCDAHGVYNISTIDLAKIRILVDSSNNLYCKPNDTLLTNCYNVGNQKRTQLPQPLNVLYEEEKDLKIIGGQKVFFYELTCTDGPRNLTAKASFRTNKTVETQTRTQNTELTNALQLQISSSESKVVKLMDNQVGVGDKLYLFMTVPVGHSIQPEICTAYPKTETTIVTMWENTGDNTCGKYDSALIDNKWSGTRQMVHIKIYGFRFVDSLDVTINCSALVCPDSNNCQKSCVNSQSGSTSSGRRRRNAVITKNEEETSASVTFHVSSQRESNTASGIIPSFILYIGLMLAAIQWT